MSGAVGWGGGAPPEENCTIFRLFSQFPVLCIFIYLAGCTGAVQRENAGRHPLICYAFISRNAW